MGHMPSVQQLRCFRDHVLEWYQGHRRRFPWRKASATRYEKIIAEMLLQRTRAETVAAFFPGFLREFPSWKKLSTASVARLQRHLRPVGLWRRRAMSIQALAGEMTRRNGQFPKQREQIESLPGVGQYIASAALLFCHGRPEPLIDVNVARVLERVYGPRQLADIRYDSYLQSLARQVVGCKRAREVNWAILDLAALVCRARKPRCNICPLAESCSYKESLVSQGPVGATR